MSPLEFAIEDLNSEIEALGSPKTDTVAWNRLQALALGRSLLLTAKSRGLDTPEQLDLLRKKVRILLVKGEEYVPQPPPERETLPAEPASV